MALHRYLANEYVKRVDGFSGRKPFDAAIAAWSRLRDESEMYWKRWF